MQTDHLSATGAGNPDNVIEVAKERENNADGIFGAGAINDQDGLLTPQDSHHTSDTASDQITLGRNATRESRWNAMLVPSDVLTDAPERELQQYLGKAEASASERNQDLDKA